MMKKAQQMRTMFPMGLRDDMRVSTTSLRPGALLMTLEPTEDVLLVPLKKKYGKCNDLKV